MFKMLRMPEKKSSECEHIIIVSTWYATEKRE